MNAYIKMITKVLSLGVLLATFALNAHAADVRSQADTTAQVVGKNFGSRHLSLRYYQTEKSYRVALAAKVTLLDGSRGSFEDVLMGDEVVVKLDEETDDIKDLHVISQN
ncbi:MAG: hypothetical protein ACR2P1_25865 [Pseudomonadales bacterium]